MAFVVSLLSLLFFNNLCSSQETVRNDDECVRLRRAWHMLSEEEKQFTFEAMVSLRRHPEEIEDDTVAQLADVHKFLYTSSVIHQSSANLFWHGYLVWEMESRIRMMDEKYACFAMPYYDYTTDYGRESHPSILETVWGGFGDPDNFYEVNDYSWEVPTEKWYVAYDEFCLSDDDSYPLCSVKRKPSPASMDGEINPSAEEMSEYFVDDAYANFAPYSKSCDYRTMPLGFMSGSSSPTDATYARYATVAGITQGYEPIWWLFHSFLQYQLSMWISCRGYDEIATEDLTDGTDAYTSYCGGLDTSVSDTTDCALGDSQILTAILGEDYEKKYQLDFGLDAPLSYSTLEGLSWPYVAHNSLTIRELYDISDWNIQYELGTFYEISGLSEKCASPLNTDWFVVLDEEKQQQAIDLTRNHAKSPPKSSYFSNAFAAVLLAALLSALYYRYRTNNKNTSTTPYQQYSYGSVPTV